MSKIQFREIIEKTYPIISYQLEKEHADILNKVFTYTSFVKDENDISFTFNLDSYNGKYYSFGVRLAKDDNRVLKKIEWFNKTYPKSPMYTITLEKLLSFIHSILEAYIVKYILTK
jgi:4-diphosphocytidyl-2C-methyl-D-erythritol kinase